LIESLSVTTLLKLMPVRDDGMSSNRVED
jgi:hypothetical protein